MKTFTNRLSVCLLASSVLTAVPLIAEAQIRDDEVIVTATRRAENVQDIPIAVTAISPKELSRQGIVNIQNLTSVAPSFSTSNAQTSSGTVVLRVRGVGTTSNNIGFESAVGVFVDGAYQSRPGIALSEMVDVERVEVLRGPQGTLFGRNTSAGALNIVNKSPDLSEAGGFLEFSGGNYDMLSLKGAANIPLVEDKVALRITGATRKRDGYIDVLDRTGAEIGKTNSVDQTLVRGQLGFEADNGLSGRFIVDYTDSAGSCCGAIEVQQSGVETAGLFNLVGLGPRGGMSGPVVGIGTDDLAGVEQATENLIATSNQVPNPSSDQLGFTGELKYPISDNADVIYIGSYRDYNASEAYDSGFSGLDIFNVVDGSDLNIQTMTHELRVQGDAMDGRLDWLVGAYYSDENIEQVTNFELGEDYDQLIGALIIGGTMSTAFGATPLQTLSGGGLASNTTASNAYAQDSKSFSVFTHNVFEITDGLDLTLGLRYSDESKDGSFTQPSNNNEVCPAMLAGVQFTPAGPAFAGTPPLLFPTLLATGCFAFTAPADHPLSAFLPLPRTFADEFKDDELIYTGKLSYEFTPDVTAYAGFTHGYKSGGFNLDSTAAAGGADPRFASEEVDAYEAGVKAQFWDGRVTFNVAAFLEKFTDFQVLEFTGAQFQTFNVPKAQTKGVEIETRARLTDNFVFNGGLTVLDAEYPDDCATTADPLRVQNLCGFTLTNAPKTVGIAGLTYEGDFGNSMEFFLNGQMRYEGDRRTSTQGRLVPTTQAALGTTALNPYDVQDATVKINLRAGVKNDNGWGFEVWGVNVTDEVTRGVTFNTVLRSGSRSAFPQEPATYGATLRKEF